MRSCPAMDGDNDAHRVGVAGGCAGMGCERVVVLGDSVVVYFVPDDAGKNL